MRIALCFYGQMRTVELLNNFYSKFNELAEDIVFDFFISTWDDFDIRTLTVPYKSINYENELISKCIKFGRSRASRACYHITKVVRLKEDYEIENKFAYDAVVVLRTDWALKYNELVKGCRDIIDLTTNTPSKLAVGLITPPVVSNGEVHLTSDGTFIHTSIGANLHGNLYNLMYLKTSSENTKHFPDIDNQPGHLIHGQLLSFFPFLTLHTPIKHKYIRINGGEVIDQAELNKTYLYE